MPSFWTLKSILPNKEFKTDIVKIETIIDSFCGIANSNNMGTTKTDSDIALSIGRLCMDNPKAAEDLKSILSKEMCAQGMNEYLRTFENGELVALASEVGDNGQYVNILRRKFDADAANWVWNIETVQQKIREVILEYKIIVESNKVLTKNITFEATVHGWCEKCSYIRISYAAAKNHFDDIGPFMEILHTVKKSGTMLDSQKQKFYDLLVVSADAFRRFYTNQIELFKRVCTYYIEEFSDDEIREFYKLIPTGSFTSEKNEYLNTVEARMKDFKSSLGSAKLKKVWKDRTGTDTPREWSKKQQMPILCLIDDRDLQTAKLAFGEVNKSRSDADSIDKAMTYLENASFFKLLNDKEAMDKAFRNCVIKGYSVMLTDIDEVKNYLDSHITPEPYDWFGLPEIDKKLKQMSEAKYSRGGCDRALAKIDEMDIVNVKKYLKDLIKDNMIVGMEIIKSE